MLLYLMLVSVCSASPAQAGDMVADGTKVSMMVRAYLPDAPLAVCNEETVRGRFMFESQPQFIADLAAAGVDIVSTGDGIQIGCSEAEEAPVPVAIAPVPQPEPEEPRREITQVSTDFLALGDIQRLIAPFDQFNVSGPQFGPGLFALIGPEDQIEQVSQFVTLSDICPAMLHVEVAVMVDEEFAEDFFNFGISIQNRSQSIGLAEAFAATQGIFVQMPELDVAIEKIKGNGEVVQFSRLSGLVNVGGQLVIRDGQDIPISGATVVQEETVTQSITYRSVGNNLTLTPTASGEEVFFTIDHEISTVGPDSVLGPTFSARRTTTVARWAEGEVFQIGLTGVQETRKSRSRGFLKRRRAKEHAEISAVLLAAFRQLPCGGGSAASAVASAARQEGGR